MRRAWIALVLLGCPDGGPRVETDPICPPGPGVEQVQAPVHIRTLPGPNGWFASPTVIDLDGDGENELVTAAGALEVRDGEGQLLARAEGGQGRIYAPPVIADLEGDGVTDLVYTRGPNVWAFAFVDGALVSKDGWPTDTAIGGEVPEVRSLAASDLDGDGTVEVVATTTLRLPTDEGGARVFAWAADGTLFQPADTPFPAWPRYNDRTGEGGDADRNGMGHSGYATYGLNVGIGDLDADPDLEIVVTYDNHFIQLFDPDGRAIDASSYYTNRHPDWRGLPLTWGQFIRYADPDVEDAHWHRHEGPFPGPATHEWLQWSQSAPNVVDLDGDGHHEVVGVPLVEANIPYEPIAYAVMVLEGDHDDRSARRLPGWETLPRGGTPLDRGPQPPVGPRAPTTADVTGDGLPEVITSLDDGFVYAFGPGGEQLWRYDYRHGRQVIHATEATVADLNRDGVAEVLLATWGAPGAAGGWLVVLSADGRVLHDVPLPEPGYDDNGSGAGAAPAIGDVDGDGTLEVLVQTLDHGVEWFTVPGSAPGCVPWPTSRGGPLRAGRPGP